ncbi:Ig-like domain-containing protein, partial [Dokdonella sp.]|uniref:Ig-like domain-containing protein n=1 Tax=Dokdonella sp. TaxID=2291710 RepID=UPI002605D747
MALAVTFVCTQAWAAAPNDRWDGRTAVTVLPYSVAQNDVGTALFNSDEPTAPCFPNALNPGNGVWYSYTTGADTEYVNIDTLGSSYDSVLSVWTGSPGRFELVGGGCNDNGNQDGSANTARIAGLRLAPNTEYSILVTRATAATGSMTLKLAIDPAPLYRVTRTGDRAGAVCAAGDCSLREAISAANAAPGAVLIPAGTYRIELAGTAEDSNATGDFDLKSPMGLYGAGMGDTIVDGNALDRVFHVDPTLTGWTSGRMAAHFADLTIRGAKGTSGAGIFSNSGNSFLSAERVAVRDNESSGNGGGIGVGMRGFLREVLIQNNVSSGIGGGINLVSTSTGMNFDIVASAIVGNRATGTGTSGTGGGINSTQLVRISNSTIDANEAYGNGGGINVDGSAGELALHSSTVAHNRSDADANGVGSGGGLRFNGSRTSAVRNTVFAYNVDPTNPGAAIFGPDCSKNNSATLGIGYSLVSDKRGSCSFTAATNLVDVSPGFDGQLGDHGGPTPTLLPLASSPLVDAGDETGCTDFAGSRRFDQRGVGHARLVDGLGSGTPRCDIGAVEYEAPAVEPAAGAPALLAADDSGISSNDGITSVVQPRFTGSCRGEAVVHLLVDDAREADGVICADGRYLAKVSAPLADGTHRIAAQALVEGSWAEPTASVAVTIDTRVPVVSFTEAPPHGITVNETQFRVGVDEPVPALCSLDNAAPATCRDPHKLFLLDMGVHRFVATATDLAGNVGRAEYVFERVELSPLEAPFLDAATDTGRSNSDGITKADPIRIIGTCRNGDQVKVYDIDAYMNASGTCSGGVFSIDVAGAPEGLRIVGVSATRAGLETSRSPGAFVLIDRTPPAAPTLALAGTSGSRITVGGDAENNADVTVRTGAQTFCGARADGSGHWSCSGDLSGQGTLIATATDAAGNTSGPSTALPIDLGPLAAPFLDPATDTGRSNSDGITRADPIRITGTCRDGDQVKVYDVDVFTGAAGTCSGGGFAIDVAGLSEGLRVIGVTALRNGVETARSAGAFVLIDRTPPVAPSLALAG